MFYGDRFGNSVILDGDTILRKQGLFQIATNFRLADYPGSPYPDERYEMVYDLLSEAEHYKVELFRQVLDTVHSDGYYPTLYSQVHELNTGIINLYQFHDFHSEVVLNLADELAKGPIMLRLPPYFLKTKSWSGGLPSKSFGGSPAMQSGSILA